MNPHLNILCLNVVSLSPGFNAENTERKKSQLSFLNQPKELFWNCVF